MCVCAGRTRVVNSHRVVVAGRWISSCPSRRARRIPSMKCRDQRRRFRHTRPAASTSPAVPNLSPRSLSPAARTPLPCLLLPWVPPSRFPLFPAHPAHARSTGCRPDKTGKKDHPFVCNVCPMSFPMVSSESAGRAWVTTPVDSGQQRLLFTVSLLLDRQVLGGMRVSRAVFVFGVRSVAFGGVGVRPVVCVSFLVLPCLAVNFIAKVRSIPMLVSSALVTVTYFRFI